MKIVNLNHFVEVKKSSLKKGKALGLSKSGKMKRQWHSKTNPDVIFEALDYSANTISIYKIYYLNQT